MAQLKKYSLVEAQRITACLEASVEKLEVLGLLGTDESHAGLSQMRNDETGCLLTQQGELMEHFQDCIDARRSLKGASMKELAENEKNLKSTVDSLRQATKTLTRNLEESVALAANFAKIQGVGSNMAELFRRTMLELQEGDPGFEMLRSRVDAEEARVSQVQAVLKRERSLSASTALQREAVASERLQMERQLAQKDEAIADLKAKIADQRTEVEIQMRYVTKDAAAAAMCMQRLQRKQVADLEAKIKRMEKEMEVEMDAHRAVMDMVTAKTERNMRREEEADAAFAADTDRLSKRLEALKGRREDLLKVMYEMEERYDRDIARRALEAEAIRARLEVEAAQRAAQEREVRATVRLQCAYRSHKARAAMRDARNPKKKKGKGKGKGAKKKK